jgi:tetratricopeptide (TPR) repeat protein
MAAMGQSKQENVNKCMSADPDTRIAGCTALIQTHQDTAQNLSIMYNNRGNAYNRKGDHDRAIQDFSEAIRLSPQFGYYNNRGVDYYEKDDYDRAIQDFDEAIRLNSNDARAYYTRGLAYNSKDDYDHAIQDFSEAIRLNPKFAPAYEKRGDAYLFQSNVTEAIVNFKDAISAAPSSRTTIFAALMLHVAMKRQGHDDAQQLASVAAATNLSKWPGPVLKLDLGQVTADEVMVAAANADADLQKFQVCEANYFTGEDALFHGQRTTALARFKAAREGCPKGDTEYGAALLELKRMGGPPTAPTK